MTKLIKEKLNEIIEEILNKDVRKVVVRWFDGYLEEFICNEVRFGCDLLWMRLVSGQNRHIPLRMVRWYSITPESYEEEITIDAQVPVKREAEVAPAIKKR